MYNTLNWSQNFYPKGSLAYRIFIIFILLQWPLFLFFLVWNHPLCFTQGLVMDISASLLSDVLDLETDDDVCFKKSHIAYVWISKRYTFLIQSSFVCSFYRLSNFQGSGRLVRSICKYQLSLIMLKVSLETTNHFTSRSQKAWLSFSRLTARDKDLCWQEICQHISSWWHILITR